MSQKLEGADDGLGAKNVNLLFCERAQRASFFPPYFYYQNIQFYLEFAMQT